MRKKKPFCCQATNLTISVPRSFKTYCATQYKASALVQRAVAEKVLGLSYTDFYLWADGKLVFKPEPIEKMFIRTARWILESRIDAVYYDPRNVNRIIFKVWWELTETTTYCVIDFSKPGYYHICYDDLLDKEPREDTIVPLSRIDSYLDGGREKHAIARAWWREAGRRGA